MRMRAALVLALGVLHAASPAPPASLAPAPPALCGACACRAARAAPGATSADCRRADPALFRSPPDLPPSLYALDLSSNDLPACSPPSLFRSPAVRELLLSRNRLARLEPDDLRFPRLLRLDLSSNSLEFVSRKVFEGLRELEYLNLANNRFTSFESLAFHPLGELRAIVLDGNDIGPGLRERSLFDRAGYGLTGKIEEIGIRGINLNAVPDNFLIDAYRLEKLDVSANGLKDIFELNFSLRYLDLSDNPVEELAGEDFASLPALRELKLNNLAIREVPAFVFRDLRGLRRLELGRNKNLTEFSGLCFGRDVLEDADDFELEELSLAGSRLTALDARLARPLGRLARLRLQGNPWRCDCHFLWLKKLQIPPRDRDRLRCGSPRALRSALVSSLQDSQLSCDARHRTALAVAAAAFCLLLAAVAVWFFLVIPRLQSRGADLRAAYLPAAAYTALPLTANAHL